MRVLVIDGTNFIGPYVVRQLDKMGHAVTVGQNAGPQALNYRIHHRPVKGYFSD